MTIFFGGGINKLYVISTVNFCFFPVEVLHKGFEIYFRNFSVFLPLYQIRGIWNTLGYSFMCTWPPFHFSIGTNFYIYSLSNMNTSSQSINKEIYFMKNSFLLNKQLFRTFSSQNKITFQTYTTCISKRLKFLFQILLISKFWKDPFVKQFLKLFLHHSVPKTFLLKYFQEKFTIFIYLFILCTIGKKCQKFVNEHYCNSNSLFRKTVEAAWAASFWSCRQKDLFTELSKKSIDDWKVWFLSYNDLK